MNKLTKLILLGALALTAAAATAEPTKATPKPTKKVTLRKPAKSNAPPPSCSPKQLEDLTADLRKLQPSVADDFHKGGDMIPAVTACLAGAKPDGDAPAVMNLIAAALPFDGTTDIADGLASFLIQHKKKMEPLFASLVDPAKTGPEIIHEPCHRQNIFNAVYGRACGDVNFPNCAKMADPTPACEAMLNPKSP